MASKSSLRLVDEDEKPARELSPAERVASEDPLIRIPAMLEQLATDFSSGSTKPYERTQIVRAIRDLTAELEAVRAGAGEGDIGSAAATPDEAFDAEAI